MMKNRLKDVNCKQCGELFHPRDKHTATFCSRKCSFIYMAEHKKGVKGAYYICKVYDSKCIVCNNVFITNKRSVNTCSDKCKRTKKANKFKLKWRSVKETNPILIKKCGYCNNEFSSNFRAIRRKYCSKKCGQLLFRKTTGKIYKQKRDIKLRTVYREHVDIKVLMERDNYQCHICGLMVSCVHSNTNPYAPTIDHVHPISKGGEHSYANVKLAHALCNSKKNNKLNYSIDTSGVQKP